MACKSHCSLFRFRLFWKRYCRVLRFYDWFVSFFLYRFFALFFVFSNLCRSGLLNFCAVAVALSDFGYKPIGIRLDSGDLAYLSNRARDAFVKISEHLNMPWFAGLTIVASNDINEETILSLNDQDHQINCFGIGTHLGTLLLRLQLTRFLFFSF